MDHDRPDDCCGACAYECSADLRAENERLREALAVAELYVRENRVRDRDPVADHALVAGVLNA